MPGKGEEKGSHGNILIHYLEIGCLRKLQTASPVAPQHIDGKVTTLTNLGFHKDVAGGERRNSTERKP